MAFLRVLKDGQHVLKVDTVLDEVRLVLGGVPLEAHGLKYILKTGARARPLIGGSGLLCRRPLLPPGAEPRALSGMLDNLIILIIGSDSKGFENYQARVR